MGTLRSTITNSPKARWAAFYMGWPAVKRLWRKIILKRPTLFILMYHKVGPSPYPYFGASVAPAVFERQVRTLVKHYRFVALEEMQSDKRFEDGKDFIAITFDDGYHGVYQWAFPILRKYGVTSTVFLPTDFIGTCRLLWHDYLAFILYSGLESRLDADISFAGLPCEITGFIGSFFKGGKNSVTRIDLVRQLAICLKAYDEDDRERIFDELCKRLRIEPPSDFSGVMLSWPQVREMSGHGIFFGSHTRSHKLLSSLPPEGVAAEMMASKDDIESHLQRQVTTFAYPYGKEDDFNSVHVEQAKRCGYQFAVTGIRGDEPLPLKNPYTLRRRGVLNTPCLFY
jgi:peptidoglycan/xylan/chitin deacetylase (PgdA/CDA1 family)